MGAGALELRPLQPLCAFLSHICEPLKITSCNHQGRVTEFLGHEIAVTALTHVATGEK